MEEKLDYESIGNRVRKIRENLGLSREKFSGPLGTSGDAINNLERARTKNVPMLLLNAICSQYGIDKDWLLYGEGNMIHEPPGELIDIITDVLKGENEIAKSVFKAFAKFSEDDWKTVEKFIDSIKNT